MNLVDLVPSLRRALAVPGTFDDVFPDSSTTDLRDTLADGLAECQLKGLLSSISLDVTAATTDVDLSPAQQSLVVLYAMARVVGARVANLKNRTRYKAGNVEAETEQSATVLVELLREIAAQKKDILEQARAGNVATAFAMVDLYVAKSIDANTSDLQYMTVPTYPRF